MLQTAETLVPLKFTEELVALGCPNKESFNLQHAIAYALLLNSVDQSPQFSKLVDDAPSYVLALLAILAYVASCAQLSIAELKCRMKLILNECVRDPRLWPTHLLKYQEFNTQIERFDSSKSISSGNILESMIDSLENSPRHQALRTVLVTSGCACESPEELVIIMRTLDTSINTRPIVSDEFDYSRALVTTTEPAFASHHAQKTFHCFQCAEEFPDYGGLKMHILNCKKGAKCAKCHGRHLSQFHDLAIQLRKVSPREADSALPFVPDPKYFSTHPDVFGIF